MKWMHQSVVEFKLCACFSRPAEDEVLWLDSEWLVHPSDSADWRQSSHREISAPSPSTARYGEYTNKPELKYTGKKDLLSHKWCHCVRFPANLFFWRPWIAMAFIGLSLFYTLQSLSNTLACVIIMVVGGPQNIWKIKSYQASHSGFLRFSKYIADENCFFR